jgi:hypothetical protein
MGQNASSMLPIRPPMATSSTVAGKSSDSTASDSPKARKAARKGAHA